MPEFYVDNVDIEPYEFVRECSRTEIKELIDELVDEGHLPKSVLSLPNINKNRKYNSLLEEEFVVNINKLCEKYHTISKEDEEIIEAIIKKYI